MKLKPFFSYDQQIEELRRKGIDLSHDECIKFLENVNYYRFSAYLLPYKGKLQGVSFQKIKRVYEFDSKLRALILPVIERIEVMFRSRIAYHFSSLYGAEGYLDARNFSRRHNQEKFKAYLEKCIKENQQSLVIQHHEKKYGGHYPLWVLIEFFSMGMLSYFFSDLNRSDKKSIVKSMGYSQSDREIESWLRCLTILRNKCAHYSRLYYAVFPSIPLFEDGLDLSIERTLFPQILMLKSLLNDPVEWDRLFRKPFDAIMEEYQDAISLNHLGLSNDWENII